VLVGAGLPGGAWKRNKGLWGRAKQQKTFLPEAGRPKSAGNAERVGEKNTVKVRREAISPRVSGKISGGGARTLSGQHKAGKGARLKDCAGHCLEGEAKKRKGRK